MKFLEKMAELILRQKKGLRGGRKPLRVKLPTSWLESPCERVLTLWKHDGSWIMKSGDTPIPIDWPIEVAVEVYGNEWVVSSRSLRDAEESYDAGDYEAAHRKASAAVVESAEDARDRARALAIRGACSMMLGNYEQCASDCSRAASDLGDDDALWNRCGRARFTLGDFEAARSAYLVVLEKGACARGCDSAEARIAASVAARGSAEATSCRDDMRKAERYFARGDYSNCVKTAGSVRMRCRSPGTVVCAGVETRGLGALGAWEAAATVVLEDLEDWKSRPPKGALPDSVDRPSCSVALKALSYCGHIGQAIDLARAWKNDQRNSTWTGQVLGDLSRLADSKAAADAAYAAGDYASAAELYHNDAHPIMSFNRAAALVELGNLTAACEACSTALKLRPFYDKARLRRARSLAARHKFDLAAADYIELMKRMPSVVRTEANGVFSAAKRSADRSTTFESMQPPAFDRATYDAYVRKFQRKNRPKPPAPQQPSASRKDDLLAKLGMRKDASREDIKRRYRTLALSLHPDKRPRGEDDDDADEKFRQIHEAYKSLLVLLAQGDDGPA